MKLLILAEKLDGLSVTKLTQPQYT